MDRFNLSYLRDENEKHSIYLTVMKFFTGLIPEMAPEPGSVYENGQRLHIHRERAKAFGISKSSVVKYMRS